MPDAPMSNPIVCDVVNAEELGPAVLVPYMSPASQTLPPAPPNVRVVVLPARPNPDMSARPDIPVEYGDLNDEVSNPPNSSSSFPPVVAHSDEDEVEPEAGPDGVSFKLTDLPNARLRLRLSAGSLPPTNLRVLARTTDARLGPVSALLFIETGYVSILCIYYIKNLSSSSLDDTHN